MIEKIIRDFYKNYNAKEEVILNAIKEVEKLNKYLDSKGIILNDISIAQIKEYISLKIDLKENDIPSIVALARYYKAIDRKDIYIYFTTLFNSLGVVENILDRLSKYEGEEVRKKIEKDLNPPPFGTSTTDLPEYTDRLMKKLDKYLSKPACRKVLAGNNHSLPEEAMHQERDYYLKANSLDQYLKDRHQRKIEELEYHFKNNIIWFEQVISQKAIDYVKSNQEILSAVRKDDELFVTKIPYAIDDFLNAEDEVSKLYAACHCSFVRESILNNKQDISPEWCYCSAGFAKFPFEVILGEELPVRLIKTPLQGDEVCQFAIDISNVKYKK